jgi:hypothetical protein
MDSLILFSFFFFPMQKMLMSSICELPSAAAHNAIVTRSAFLPRLFPFCIVMEEKEEEEDSLFSLIAAAIAHSALPDGQSIIQRLPLVIYLPLAHDLLWVE